MAGTSTSPTRYELQILQHKFNWGEVKEGLNALYLWRDDAERQYNIAKTTLNNELDVFKNIEENYTRFNKRYSKEIEIRDLKLALEAIKLEPAIIYSQELFDLCGTIIAETENETNFRQQVEKRVYDLELDDRKEKI